MQNQYRELVTLYDRTKQTQGIEFVDSQPIFSTCSLDTFCRSLLSSLERIKQILTNLSSHK